MEHRYIIVEDNLDEPEYDVRQWTERYGLTQHAGPFYCSALGAWPVVMFRGTPEQVSAILADDTFTVQFGDAVPVPLTEESEDYRYFMEMLELHNEPPADLED